MSSAEAIEGAAELLAGLDSVTVRELLARGRARRQARREHAIRLVRAELLFDMSAREAADIIVAAARGQRTVRMETEARIHPVRRRLEELLGSLDDLPNASRVRQVIGT